MHDNMTQWWVLYRFQPPHGHDERCPMGAPMRELSIVRLLADLNTGSPSCVFCFARRQSTCPGMKLHVAMERERAEVDAGGLLSVAVVDLPGWMDWQLALRTVRTLILTQGIISAP